MLEEKSSKLGYLVVIGLLLACVGFLAYKVRDYAGEVKSANMITSYTKTQNENYQYYQSIFARALTMTTDGTRYLPKGTIVILPPEEEKIEE